MFDKRINSVMNWKYVLYLVRLYKYRLGRERLLVAARRLLEEV